MRMRVLLYALRESLSPSICCLLIYLRSGLLRRVSGGAGAADSCLAMARYAATAATLIFSDDDAIHSIVDVYFARFATHYMLQRCRHSSRRLRHRRPLITGKDE